jgi:hypothetical protein
MARLLGTFGRMTLNLAMSIATGVGAGATPGASITFQDGTNLTLQDATDLTFQ